MNNRPINPGKQAREAFRESETRLRAIIESTADGILAVDNGGKVVEVNQRFADLWHIPQYLMDRRDDHAMLEFVLSQLMDPDAFLKKVQSLYDSDAVDTDTLAFRDGRLFERHSCPIIMDGVRVGRVWSFRDITERKRAERRQALAAEILGILDNPLSLPETITDILTAIKRETGFDAVGIRIQSGDDYPYFSQQGFSREFLLTENTLVERDTDGGLCRDKDGNVTLACTCGLVISGKTNPENPLCTPGGSFWTNNSFPLSDLTADQDPRRHPRNSCIHAGYGSVALIPIRCNQKIVGLLQLNNRKEDSLTLDMIRFFEGITASIGVALTEQRIATALMESEDLYRILFDQAIDGMLLANVESRRFMLSNRKLQQMLGYSEEEILQLSLSDIHPAAEMPRIIETFERQARGEIALASDLPVLRKDGTVFHADISAATIHMFQHNCILGIFRDITERTQAEKMLRFEQKRMRTILDTVGDPIFVKDSDFRFVLANRAFYDMLGLEQNNVIGSTLAKNLPADEMRHFFEIDQRVLDTGIPDLREESLTVRDGLTLTIVTRKARFIDDSGKKFVVGAIHNITESRRAEERERELLVKVERGARMEALGVLAGGVAHDLNNVLGPIVALPDMVIEYVERIGDSTAPEHADTLDSLQMMKASALRAAGVVSDLVVMGRRGQFKKEPVDVNRVVEQTLDSKQIRAMQARRPEVQVSRQLASESLWCLGSESRLVRVLANLTSNAMEAIDGQGTVIVRTGREVLADPHDGYEWVPPGDYVTLEVMDTGCGMDEKTIVRIFEPFFSTKSPTERSGSGLGLSVVHGLVKDHAGFLNVKSMPGKGTTFTVYLPLTGAEEKAAGLTAVPTVSGGSERILVVDDEPGQRLLARQTLKKIGYDATVVSSGEEAVALFEMAKRGGKPAPFDLVMTDMIMNGMDGLATCKAILTLYQAQKLMIISGNMPGEYEEQVKALGAEWLTKPFTAISLARAVRSRLNS